MPFDPMFQFRERPLSYEEFDTGVVDEQRSVPVFYWADTLALYAAGYTGKAGKCQTAHVIERTK